MGTDIHGIYQRRRKTPQSDAKFRLDVLHKVYYDTPLYELDVNVEGLGFRETDWCSFGRPIYDDRNYILFAILAGVRNGYGFAGCDIFDPLPTLSEGLDNYPEEIRFSPKYYGSSPCDSEGTYDGEWLGVHTHTILTADEILSYDFQRRINHIGVMEIEQFQKLIGGEDPDHWCGDVWGRDYRVHPLVDTTEGKAFIANLKDYTHIKTKWTGRELLTYVHEFIDDLKQVVADNPDYDIRLVIGFDS